MICWKCKKEINVESVQRSTECPLCHADLHSCKGCKFYAPGNHYDCKENVDSPISDKERANFCDFFMKKTDIFGSGSSGEDKAAAAKNAFNALFGD